MLECLGKLEHRCWFMSRSNAHSLWLRGRLKNWVIGAAVVALAAWLFEFSTHLHLADADDIGSPNAAHVCAYCAALQLGAGPVSVTTHIALAPPGHVEPAADQPFPSSSAPTPYRSRAPPTA
jgi:hypothetical protein